MDEPKEEKYVFTEKFLKWLKAKRPEAYAAIQKVGLTFGFLTAYTMRCRLRFPGIPPTASMEFDRQIDQTADAVMVFDYLPDVMPDWEDQS